MGPSRKETVLRFWVKDMSPEINKMSLLKMLVNCTYCKEGIRLSATK